MLRHTPRFTTTAAVLSVLLFGCEGAIEYPGSGRDPSGPITPVTPVGQIPDNNGGAVSSQCVSPDAVAPSERLARLSHIQYGNIARDVLGVTADVGSFAKDAASGGFTNNASSLMPSEPLVKDWNRSAEAIAQQIATTPALLTALTAGCTAQNQACFNTFLDKVGLKLYRRPLSAAQKTKLATAWTAAAPLYATGTPFEKAVRMSLEAALQSPAFLYRAELSTALDAKGAVPLNGYEVADRLAFALWSSSPDDVLLDAASKGMLGAPEGVQAQARRMLDSPKARPVMRDFYFQWLLLQGYSDLSRSPALYPNFTSELGAPMQEETLRFLEGLTFDTAGTFKDVFTATHTFANAPLAKLYGMTGVTGTALQRVELDPAKRAGLLTQVGFLASHSYYDVDSPILRGAHVFKRLMCVDFQPPAGIDFKLPPASATLKTTRQRVAAHTAAASCQACHSSINPLGFGFDNYDAVGQWRETENGEPVDSTGSIPSPAGLINIIAAGKHPRIPFNNAIELGAAVGSHETAQKCFSAMWLRFLYARLDYPQDACQVEALAKKLGGTAAYPLKDLLVDLVSARAFTTRAEVTQ